MLRKILLGGVALLIASPTVVVAQDRYATRPPVVVSPDLAAPWVMQLGNQPGPIVRQQRVIRAQPRYAAQPRVQQRRVVRQGVNPGDVQVQSQSSIVRTAAAQRKPARPQMDPIYLPRQVNYQSGEKPGSIIIDTQNKFLYYIEGNGQARRYGVGVGKEGMAWSGTETVSNKRVWPNWHPPQEMRERELREKGRVLPVMMEGGPANPLGARALYLGDTLYRIHGTNAPWTIGTSNSSGCIRMRNEDVVELYEKVKVGAKVVVM